MLETGTHVYELKENVVLRHVQDAEIQWVFNIENGRHYSVNRVAYQIVQSIASSGVTSIAALAESLAEEYEVTPQMVREDIEQILNALVSEEIAQRRNRQ